MLHLIVQGLSLGVNMLRKGQAHKPAQSPHSVTFETELHIRLGALAPQNSSPIAYLSFKGYRTIEKVRRLVQGAKPTKDFTTAPPPSRQPSLIVPTIVITRAVKERKRKRSKKAPKPDTRLLCAPAVNKRGRARKARTLPSAKPLPTRPLPPIPSHDSGLAFYADHYKDWYLNSPEIMEVSRSVEETVGLILEEEELMLLL